MHDPSWCLIREQARETCDKTDNHSDTVVKHAIQDTRPIRKKVSSTGKTAGQEGELEHGMHMTAF